MDILVADTPGGRVRLTALETPAESPAGGQPTVVEEVEVDLAGLAEAVAERERPTGAASGPRWVWADTSARYPPLLAAGVRVARCLDLRLARAVLAGSCQVRTPPPPLDWPDPAAMDAAPTLVDLDQPPCPDDVRAAYDAQREALTDAEQPGRLRLLLAAESAGALLAAEIGRHGMPWDRDEHDRLLTEQLGPRPADGHRPVVLEELADTVRSLLDAPALNPDSAPELLTALQRAGLVVASTRQHELAAVDHPVVPPLLQYKKLARLLGANGWSWLDRYVAGGRFRPDYVVAGVVTGRWATRSGGALQLPKQIRGAVRADPGWRLVVADAAQLEPRVLAAMAADPAMSTAAAAGDLYAGLVEQGVVATRAEAKVAMLGALYGASSGDGGRLMPRLQRAYPRATGLVDEAARTGEAGGRVSTWLGRSSPAPSAEWLQRLAGDVPEAAQSERRAARLAARDWGRFTRNFVVQGTAAEWALCWLAGLRQQLALLGADEPDRVPVIVYFLHDEVMVHTPAERTDAVAAAVVAAADRAGALLFGPAAATVGFPLDVAVVDSYADA